METTTTAIQEVESELRLLAELASLSSSQEAFAMEQLHELNARPALVVYA